MLRCPGIHGALLVRLLAGLLILCVSTVPVCMSGCSKSSESKTVIETEEEKDEEPAETTVPEVDLVQEQLEKDIEAAAARVEKARDDCKKYGATTLAREDVRVGLDDLSSARDAKSRGDMKRALRLFRRSAKSYEGAVATAKNMLIKEIEGLEKEYEGLVDRSKSLVIGSTKIVEPERMRSKAEKLQKKEQLIDARDTWQRAVNGLEIIVAAYQQKKDDRDQAHALSRRIKDLRQDADKEQLDHYAEKPYSQAASESSDGQRALLKGDLVRAVAHFEEAERLFKEAFALAKERKSAGFPGPESEEDEETVADADPEESEPEETEQPQVSEIEREQAIARKLEALYGDRVKYSKGIATFHYSMTDSEFQGHADVIQGAKNTQFEGRFGRWWRDENYVFAAHTSGLVLHETVFSEEVTITAKVYFEFVLQESPQMQVIFMSDGKNFYSSNFGADIREWKRGKPKIRARPKDKTYRHHPNKWVIKGDDVRIEIKCKRKKDGKLAISTSYRGRELARYESDKFTTGRIGFLWNNTRFIIEELTIKGRIDSNWLSER